MHVKFNFLLDVTIRALPALIARELWLVFDHYPFGTVAKATFLKLLLFSLSLSTPRVALEAGHFSGR